MELILTIDCLQTIMKQKLYRPVGKKELELIVASGQKAYPPRLEWQPIFYPVMNYDYAAQIALDWNTKDAFSGYCGFVTEFKMETAYIEQFDIQNVGGSMHNELWVPSEQLTNFNEQIIGHIQVSGAYYGAEYTGNVEDTQQFKDLDAKAQLEKTAQLSIEDLTLVLEQEPSVFLINFSYWKNHLEADEVCSKIANTWQKVFPDRILYH